MRKSAHCELCTCYASVLEARGGSTRTQQQSLHSSWIHSFSLLLLERSLDGQGHQCAGTCGFKGDGVTAESVDLRDLHLQGIGGGPSGVALNRLAKELRDLQKLPADGIKVSFLHSDFSRHSRLLWLR